MWTGGTSLNTLMFVIVGMSFLDFFELRVRLLTLSLFRLSFFGTWAFGW